MSMKEWKHGWKKSAIKSCWNDSFPTLNIGSKADPSPSHASKSPGFLGWKISVITSKPNCPKLWEKSAQEGDKNGWSDHPKAAPKVA